MVKKSTKKKVAASRTPSAKGGLSRNDKSLKVDVLTIFPEMIDAYCGNAILGRAQKSGLLEVKAHNLREWAVDKNGHVDDRPFGGGAGMVMRVEPFFNALGALKVRSTKYEVRGKKSRTPYPVLHTRVILTSAKGKMFTQKDAQRLSKYDRLVFLCGRYEGVDERIAERLADEELSIGQYVMTGGELASLVMIDAIARLRPGVLGKAASLDDESWTVGDQKEYPQYTRPEIFNKWKVPKVLLSGNHEEIKKWREANR